MTVVRVPIRLRLNVIEGEPCDGLIASALAAADAAVTRSVARAAALQVVRQARADAVTGPRVDVTMRGARLPTDAEHTLRLGMAALARRQAGVLLDRANDSRRIGTPPVGPNESARERYDNERWVYDEQDPTAEGYLIPSYRDAGASVTLPVRGGGSVPTESLRQRPQLRTFHSRPELVEAIYARYDGDPPERFVTVFTYAAHPVGWLWQLDPEAGRLIEPISLGTWTFFEPQSGTDPVLTGDLNVSRGDRLAFVSDATTDEQVKAKHVDMLRLYLERQTGGRAVGPLKLESQAKKLAAGLPLPPLPVRYYALMSGARQLKTVELSLANSGLTALPAGDLPVCIFSEFDSVAERDRREPTADLPLEELGLFFEPDPTKPFLAEPPVEFWTPDISLTFADLIADIAGRLDMPPGDYPAMFALAACNRINKLAVSYGAIVDDGRSTATQRSLELAHLAGAIEPLEKLANLYADLISGSAHLPARLRGNSGSWLLHFREQYIDMLYAAIGSLFIGSCQDILLANLEKSRYELQRRQTNFPAYITVTRSLILSMLVDLPELAALRDVLVERERGQVLALATVALPIASPTEAASTPIEAWSNSTNAVLAAFGAVDASAAPDPGVTPTRSGDDGTVQVQDSTGRWWSRSDLDTALSANREQALGADPLLEKLSHLDDVVTRLRTAGAADVDAEFRRLIEELLDKNLAKTLEARADPDIAFGLAKFAEVDFGESEYGTRLSGIHKLADEFLKPLFPGSLVHTYIAGVGNLASIEIGAEKFSQFFNLVGLVAIAMFCPELALAIGAVEAVHAVAVAEEHVEIQQVLLGGDAIISTAEAEAELWAAAIGAALAFIPEVGQITRGAIGAGRAAVKGELRAAASDVGRRFASQLATRVVEAAAEGVAQKFVAECLQAYVLNLAVSAAIKRFTDAVERQVNTTGRVGIDDIPQLVGDALGKAVRMR
ncbi:hypothetical protein [Mycobacterium sp.]|uniref:hypothetical protein n=1 Tax=Mycobacterium sp. TaxID=1785 RepID=UPI003D11C871